MAGLDRRRLGVPLEPVAVYGAAVFGVLLAATVLPYKAHDSAHSLSETLFGGVSGLLFIGAGALAYRRRPDNRVGLLMVAVGIGWFAEDVQFLPWPSTFAVGLMLGMASSGFIAHLVLAFPTGRLTSRPQRWLVATAYVVSFGLAPVGALFVDPRDYRPDLRSNVLLVGSWPEFVAALGRFVDGVGALVAIGIVLVLVGRWRSASPPQRWVLAPVFVTGLIGAGASAAGSAFDDTSPVRLALLNVFRIAFCLLPLGFLAGVLRVRLGRTAVADLLIDLQRPLTAADLRDRLAVALGDKSLRIGYWRADPAGLVDADGNALALPRPGGGQVVTYVERAGRRVAGLIHDAALRDDIHVLRAASAAAGLALDNQRLTAEVRAQLAEVRASRARIVAAGAEERRRMERDLHDGVQQSLVAAAIGVRLVEERLDTAADQDLRALVRACGDALDTGLAELRELVRGIHPQILTEHGLVAALEALTQRAPVAVELTAPAVPRLPAPVEVTAYLVAAEALTNAMKHAHAGRIRIAVETGAGRMRLEVTDDGVGGADPARGSGLLGLSDRVRALDGDLAVRSAPGRGTSVSAVFPCGAP